MMLSASLPPGAVPYPDARYPELRCEDPTAPGCADASDYLRWSTARPFTWLVNEFSPQGPIAYGPTVATIWLLAIVATLAAIVVLVNRSMSSTNHLPIHVTRTSVDLNEEESAEE